MGYRFNKKRSFILCIGFLCVSSIGLNVLADEKGQQLAKKFFSLKEADTIQSQSSMLLIDKNGNKTQRSIEIFERQSPEGKDMFLKFVAPADLNGTKFLSLARKSVSDEQRLFLPAFGKVRRIASTAKDGKFVGSDLNYFDLEDHEFTDYNFKFLETKTENSVKYELVEFVPKDKDAPYSKQIAWIRSNDSFVTKYECFAKENEKKLIKTIIIKETQTIQGVIVFTKMVVEDHLKNHITLMLRTNVKVNVKIPQDVFSASKLAD
jgi:hypothetical protein